VNIGKSVIIKGELSAARPDDRGQVEGKIELRQNVLTIGKREDQGPGRRQVGGRPGRGDGQRRGFRKVDIRDSGSVDGDISSPKVAIAEGAHFVAASTCSARAERRSRAARFGRDAEGGAKPAVPPTRGATDGRSEG